MLVICFGKYIFTSSYTQIHGDYKPPYNRFCPTFHFTGLIHKIGMKLCVTINQLVNSPYLTPSILASLFFSGWLSFEKVWNTRDYSVFCILSSDGFFVVVVLLFTASMLPFKESAKDTTDVFNSRHEIWATCSAKAANQEQNQNQPMTLVGLHVFSRASHSLHAMPSLQDLIGSHFLWWAGLENARM